MDFGVSCYLKSIFWEVLVVILIPGCWEQPWGGRLSPGSRLLVHAGGSVSLAVAAFHLEVALGTRSERVWKVLCLAACW